MNSQALTILSAENFEQEVVLFQGVAMIDFWAEWCGPCRALAPVIDQLAEAYHGKVKICKLNIDENGELAAKYGVMSIPTVIIFKNGTEMERLVGLRPAESFSELLDSYV